MHPHLQTNPLAPRGIKLITMTTPTRLNIEGMSCQGCVASVRRALATVPGLNIQSVELGHAILLPAEPTDLNKAIAALDDAGFAATPTATPAPSP